MGQQPWSEARVAELQRLVALGMSPAAVAHEMGITRNAVTGKAHRIGARFCNPAATERQLKTFKPRAQRRTPFVAAKLVADDVAAKVDAQPIPLPFLGIPFDNLEDQHCRYIRTIEGEHLYCGQPRMAASSYCNTCHRRCHERNKPPVREAA